VLGDDQGSGRSVAARHQRSDRVVGHPEPRDSSHLEIRADDCPGIGAHAATANRMMACAGMGSEEAVQILVPRQDFLRQAKFTQRRL
jgi:hypothetical protein